MGIKAQDATHAYAATCIHGWTFGVTLDTQDDRTAKTVSEWIRDGETVSRMLKADADKAIRIGMDNRCKICCPPAPKDPAP